MTMHDQEAARNPAPAGEGAAAKPQASGGDATAATDKLTAALAASFEQGVLESTTVAFGEVTIVVGVDRYLDVMRTLRDRPALRFETLIDLCGRLGRDADYQGQLNEIERHEIADADIHDVIFPNIELDWWKM